MEQEKLVQFLQSTNLLGGPKASEIAGHFTSKNFRKGDFILKAGRVPDEYLYLEHGFIRAFAHDTQGNDVTTAIYSENQVVFEVSSFFNRTVSTENFQTLTDCRAWVLTYQELNMLFHSMPEFRDFGRHILVTGFSALKARMLSTITDTAEERYEKLLKARPEIFLHVPLKYIASYLGITDTSLSRIRKESAKK
jgi:CRP-like cAMP-binding protein